MKKHIQVFWHKHIPFSAWQCNRTPRRATPSPTVRGISYGVSRDWYHNQRTWAIVTRYFVSRDRSYASLTREADLSRKKQTFLATNRPFSVKGGSTGLDQHAPPAMQQSRCTTRWSMCAMRQSAKLCELVYFENPCQRKSSRFGSSFASHTLAVNTTINGVTCLLFSTLVFVAVYIKSSNVLDMQRWPHSWP